MINEAIEYVSAKKLSKRELAREIKKAQIINDDSFVKNQWNELVNWLRETLGEKDANIFISEDFTENDFKTEIRMMV